MTEYSLWQRLRIAWSGRIPVGEQKREGWSGPIMFYAFNCPIHGIVEDYAHGFNGRLLCPRCINSKDEH